ncbi:hypothetical protein OH76DRAFT_1488406 [Lentinus brumalis]|uniref:Uncharacterized protein n=1 Tax=Lentinus brumalis TaxID=2498619 RepID=A0A371CR73_9APHY|nr:hypothetical protein OH76DRAFT_1488406 [Polyporus brumalis]
MATRALNTFTSLLGSGGQRPAQLAWTDLLHGMSRAGFTVRRCRGTRRRFCPPNNITHGALTLREPPSGFLDRRAQAKLKRKFHAVGLDYRFFANRI